MEFLIGIFGEIFLQLVFELLADLGVRGVGAGWGKGRQLSPVVYALLGAVAGGVSLLVTPSLFIASQTGQWTNLIVTPIIVGAVMVALAVWRRNRNAPKDRQKKHPAAPKTGGHAGMTHTHKKQTQLVGGLDRFLSAYLFALAMAGVRMAFGA